MTFHRDSKPPDRRRGNRPYPRYPPRVKAGYGSLNSEAPDYRDFPQRSPNRRAGYQRYNPVRQYYQDDKSNPYARYRNSRNQPSQPMAKKRETKMPEILTFKQRIDEKNDVNVQFEFLSSELINQIDTKKWIRKFERLSLANRWTAEQSRLALDVLCEEDLKPQVGDLYSFKNLIASLEANLYTENRFLTLEEKLRKLRSINFSSLSEFYKKFSLLFEEACQCLNETEKLTERDRRVFFVNGLTREQRAMFIDFEFPRLQEFVEFYDRRKLRIRKYEYFSYGSQSRTVTRGLEQLSIEDDLPEENYTPYRRPFYETRRRETKDSSMNKSRTDYRYRKGEEKGSHSLFIDASRDTEIINLELEGKIQNQTKDIKICLDSGSKENFINEETAQRAEKEKTDKPIQIEIANGKKISLFERVKISLEIFQIPHTIFNVSCFILPGLPTGVNLGLRFLNSQKAILNFSDKTISISNHILEMPRPIREPIPWADKMITEKAMIIDTRNSQLERILKNYKNNENNLGLIPNVTHRIRLKENSVIASKPYTVPLALRKEFQNEITRLEQKGIIRTSTSPFASPCFPIKKASGEIRIVIDFRKLNSVTISDPFPMPLIEDMLMELKDARVFSRLDMRNGYHQIAMEPADIEKTGFVTPFGHFEFLRMPFGLATAPRTFQRTISNIFKKTVGVLVFLDDLLIFTNNETEHIAILERVFALIKDNHILLNLNKCDFFKEEVKYLGSIICQGKIRPDLTEIKNQFTKEPPRTLRQVRKTLGFINWFRQFVPKLSEFTAFLSEKLKQKQLYWQERDNERMKLIWQAITEASTLTIPDINKPYKLFTDASLVGISGILIQENKLIRIYSAKLSPTEKRYSAIEREMLAIIKSMLAFRNYIFNCRTIVFTDNANITHETRLGTSRIQRWKLILTEFDLVLVHVKGENNSGADFISRAFTKNLMTKASLAEVEPRKASVETNNNESFPSSLILNTGVINLKKICLEQNKEIDRKEDVINNKFRFKNIKNERVLVDKKDRVLIPKSLEMEYWNYVHQKLVHPGVSKTYNMINRFVVFPNMKQKIERYIQLCYDCQKKKKVDPRAGELQGGLLASAPFTTISSDIFGPFPWTNFKETGSGYLITFIDFYTRFVAIKALKEIKGADVVEALKTCWLNRFEKPQYFHSDQGPQYLSKEFNKFCREKGILRTYSNKYNPTANSLSERINQTIGNGLRLLQGNYIHDVTERIAFAINHGYHRTLKCSPVELLEKKSIFDPLQRTKAIDWDLQKKANEEASKGELQKRNRKRNKKVAYQIGDYVFLKSLDPSKLADPWTGTYQILRTKAQQNSFLIDMGDKNSWYNIKFLKPAFTAAAASSDGGVGKMTYPND